MTEKPSNKWIYVGSVLQVVAVAIMLLTYGTTQKRDIEAKMDAQAATRDNRLRNLEEKIDSQTTSFEKRNENIVSAMDSKLEKLRDSMQFQINLKVDKSEITAGAKEATTELKQEMSALRMEMAQASKEFRGEMTQKFDKLNDTLTEHMRRSGQDSSFKLEGPLQSYLEACREVPEYK